MLLHYCTSTGHHSNQDPIINTETYILQFFYEAYLVPITTVCPPFMLHYSRGPSIVPLALYSACGIAWHQRDSPGVVYGARSI